MKTLGIRILDKINRLVCVELQDIFEEISNGEQFQWSILFFEGTGSLGNGLSVLQFANDIRNSPQGLLLEWNELKELAKKFHDVRDILIIGCRNPKEMIRYKTDQEMYESCDVVIEMIDSGYWEIFSSDRNLINRLASKFNDIEFLESDFQNKWLKKE